MGTTERRVLVLSCLVVLLAVSAAEAPAAPAALDEPPPSASPPSVSPVAFAERAAGAALKGQESLRSALELILLAVTCGVAVACYSALAGGRSSRRLRTRSRRR